MSARGGVGRKRVPVGAPQRMRVPDRVIAGELRKRQWSRPANAWQNAGIRSGLHVARAPFRTIPRPFRRGVKA